MKSRTLKPTTTAVYSDYIIKDLVPAFGAIRLEKLNHLHVARFIDEQLARPLPACSACPPPWSRTRIEAIAAQLSPMAAQWRRLLSEHGPDPDGRCRTCTQGGTGLPETVWPCTLLTIAHLAYLRTRGADRSHGDHNPHWGD